MPVDLDELLRDAAVEPAEPLDADELWARGRRRRRVRLLGTSAAGVAGLALVAVVGAGLVTSPPVPVIEPIGEGDDDAIEAPAQTPEPDDATIDPQVRDEEPEPEAVDEPEPLEEPEDAAADEPEPEPEPGPEPSPARMQDPCAEHDEGEMRSFIDLVSPVDGQQVSATIEMVGCSSVFEGTVQYRISDEQGTALHEGFTTATAGGPGIGEFRESIEVPAPGRLRLQVYWEDAADGSERDLSEISFDAS